MSYLKKNYLVTKRDINNTSSTLIPDLSTLNKVFIIYLSQTLQSEIGSPLRNNSIKIYCWLPVNDKILIHWIFGSQFWF